MKRTLAFLVLGALPIAASAQMAPPSRGPMGGAVTTNGRTTGITVTAGDVAKVPATSADISINIGGATQQTKIDAKTVQPLVDALVQAGADPASVQLPPGFAAGGYSNTLTITATVKNPTLEMMQRGILTVGTAAAKIESLRVFGAQVQLHAADCSAAVAQARTSAIALARKKAQEIAKELGVHVGPVISVNAYDGSTTDSTCNGQLSITPGGTNYWGPYGPMQPSDYTSIPVSANVTITFAIK